MAKKTKGLKSELTKIGFSENEALVYEVLVSFGYRTLGQLSFYTKLSTEDLIGAIGTLKGKNYIKEVPGKEGSPNTEQYIPLSPRITVSSDIAERLNKGLNSISSEISTTWDDTVKTLKSEVNDLVTSTSTSMSEHTKIVTGLINQRVTELKAWSEDATSTLTSRLNQHLGSLVEVIDERSKSMVEAAEEAQKTFTGSAAENLTASNETLSKAVTEMAATISKTREDLQATVVTTADKAEAAAQSLRDGLQKRFDVFQKAALKEMNAASTAAGKLINERTQAIESAGGEVIDKAAADYDKSIQVSIAEIDQYNKSLETVYQQFGKDLDALEEALEVSIGREMLRAFNTIGTSLENVATKFEENTAKAQDQAIAQLLKAVDTTEEELGSLRTALTESLETFVVDFKTSTDKLLEELRTNADTQYKSISATSGGFKKQVADNLTAASKSLGDQVQTLIKLLTKFMTDTTADLGSQLDQMVDSTTTAAGEHISSLKEDLTKHGGQLSDQAKKFADARASEVQKSTDAAVGIIDKEASSCVEALAAERSAFEEKAKELVAILATNVASADESLKSAQSTAVEEAGKLREELKAKRSEFQDSLTTHLDELSSDGVKAISEHATRGNDEFETNANMSLTMIGDSIQGFFKTFGTTSTELRETMPSSVDQLFNEQRDRLKEFEKAYKGFIGPTMATLNEVLQLAQEKGRKIWGKNEADAEVEGLDRKFGELTRLKQMMDSNFSTILKDVEETRDDLLNRINRAFTNELDSLQGLISASEVSIKSDGTTLIRNLKEGVSALQSSISATINETVSEHKQKLVGDLTDMFGTPLTDAVDTAEGIATGSLKGSVSFAGLLSEIKDSTTALIGDAQESLGKTSDTATKSIETVGGLSTKLLTETATGMNKAFAEYASESGESAVSKMDEAGLSFEGLGSDIEKSLAGSVTAAKESMAAFVTEKGTELKSMGDENLAGLNSSVKEATTQVRASVKEFDSDMRSRLDEIVESMGGHITGTQEAQRTLVDSTLESLNSKMDSSLEPIQGVKTTLSEEVSTVLEETRVSARQIVNDAIDIMNSKAADVSADLTETKTTLRDNASGALESLKGVDAIRVSTQARLEASKGTLSEDMQAQLGEMAQLSKTAHEESLVAFKTAIEATSASLSDMSSDAKSDIVKATTQALEISTGTRDSLREEIETQSNATSKAAETDLRTHVGAVTQQLDVSSKGFASSVKAARTAIDSSFKTETTSLTSSFEAAEKDLTERVTRMTTEEVTGSQKSSKGYTKALGGFEAKFKTGVSTGINDSTSQISASIKTIPSQLQGALDETGKALAILQQIAEAITGVDPLPIDKTYIEVGQEAMKSAVHGIVPRVKSGLVLVAPTLRWLDPEWFKELSTHARFNITTNPTEHNAEDKVVMKKLIDICENISFRQLDRDMDILMVSRDSEEIVYGNDVNSQYPHGMITQDDDLVKNLLGLVSKYSSARTFTP